MTADPPDLLSATARLVAQPSVSRDEAALAGLVEAELRGHPWLEVFRVGDNVVARTHRGRPTRLALAGHLDTVPPSGNEVPRLEGDTLHGLGSADMKGGLAVMLALAALEDSTCDCTFVFYAREEVARAESGLLELHAAAPELLMADAAVLLEPTGAAVEAGCQGVVKARAVLCGRRAHVARPWVGINAIHRLAPFLERVVAFGDRRPVIEGCEYRESLQAVEVTGGGTANVVPDEATVLLVHRFAPDKDEVAAFAVLEDHLRPVLGDADWLELVDTAPAAPPALTHPLLDSLASATGRPAGGKLGWTDVAFFAERGVPAANFGPGDALLAHAPDERVERAHLEAAYAVLAKAMDEKSLRQVQASIAAKKVSIPEDEARELAKRALQFKNERGRLPNIHSADAWEKRMAEGVAALTRYRAQAKAAQAQGESSNG